MLLYHLLESPILAAPHHPGLLCIPQGYCIAYTTSGLLATMATSGACPGKVRIATREDFRRIFANEELIMKIFPGNFLSAGLELFEPCLENLPVLFSPDRQHSISKDDLSICCIQTWQSPSAVSFFYLHLHGEATAEIAMAHFLGLIPFILANCIPGKPITVLYAVLQNIQKEVFQSLCKNLPFYRPDDHICDHTIIAERPFTQSHASHL